ncbi:MAG: carboxylesterase family protein [Oscillospiraceae bacterium]|nr:carboxylesterase family protein [Oscillospiraceae bacterium]
MAILEAKTISGAVRGFETETKGISAFLGIPYAAAPVGENRWRAPQPAAPWDGAHECLDFGYSCWQRDNAGLPGFLYQMEHNPVKPRPLRMDEDCLSLNIWTPAESAKEALPVMVWFYGGGLQGGTTDDILFDGEGLCGYGVVLVTVNYRTGVFGYFGHRELEKENEHGSSGNYGLQDQIFALRWVKENIPAFGGDPGNIMIFGCSGGGRSVQGICCSPLARGLVQHAAIHSAGGLNPDYSLAYDKILALGEEFSAFCGKSSVSELREVTAKELEAKYEAFHKQFNITGDGYVLPYTMDEMVRRGEQADIDYILSTMNHEFRRPLREEVTLASFPSVQFGPRTSIFGAVCKPETDAEAADFVEWAEAYEMKSAQLAWAIVQAKQPKKPVYLCTFDHPLPGSEIAAHGCDQHYLFHTLRKYWNPATEADDKLSHRMMKRWTNFAKTGNPNGEGLAQWTQFTAESPLTLSIDADGDEMRDRTVPVMERTVSAYIENRRK